MAAILRLFPTTQPVSCTHFCWGCFPGYFTDCESGAQVQEGGGACGEALNYTLPLNFQPLSCTHPLIWPPT